MSDDRPVKLSPLSAAFTISLALSHTYALRHGDPEAKRRWATVPALNILQILEAAYVIEAQVPRDDLVSTIVDELVKAPPRPGRHWTKREAWKQDVALQIADALAAVATIRGKPPFAGFPIIDHGTDMPLRGTVAAGINAVRGLFGRTVAAFKVNAGGAKPAKTRSATGTDNE